MDYTIHKHWWNIANLTTHLLGVIEKCLQLFNVPVWNHVVNVTIVEVVAINNFVVIDIDVVVVVAIVDFVVVAIHVDVAIVVFIVVAIHVDVVVVAIVDVFVFEIVDVVVAIVYVV